MIFSFSQPVWNDMLKGAIVMQDKHNYIIYKFNPDKVSRLPKPTQQRSVLLKNIVIPIESKEIYSKETWVRDHKTSFEWSVIYNFLKNRNNHTASSWNCIGIRVIPMI